MKMKSTTETRRHRDQSQGIFFRLCASVPLWFIACAALICGPAPHAHGSGLRGNGLIPEKFGLTGIISPSQITGDQNDYNPTGWATCSVARISSDATRNMTGAAGVGTGEIKLLYNIGTQNIVLKDESASSASTNRWALNGDFTLGPDEGAFIQYDLTSTRWRIAAKAASGASAGYTLTLGTSANISPADSVTQYIGGDWGQSGGVAYDVVKVEIPKTGTVKRVFLKVRVSGTLGSNETVSHYIRLNDTTDFAQIDTTYDAATRNLNATGLSQAVTAGDYVALKIVGPAWGTNPTNVRWYCVIHIE